jgi:hypothetical protein
MGDFLSFVHGEDDKKRSGGRDVYRRCVRQWYSAVALCYDSHVDDLFAKPIEPKNLMADG